ncbi:MAG TPA: metallophosphoesterase family protein [Thermodesulfobacteriota bacterium]|nr:metallophosphoesterase family protein [Thermodesulfobacteriota bacterium]
MRYAIISDIHSNLEALGAFLEKTEELGVEKTVCLGDIVGYNANPNECIEIIRERKMECVMGNHDSRASGLEEPTDFNHMAAEAVLWTRDKLTEKNREFLKGLPRSIDVDKKFLAVHGWVNSTDMYIFGARDAQTNFELMRAHSERNLCFFGHTHVSMTYIEADSSVGFTVDSPVKVEKGRNYLINPGGLGQPRDRDPRAAFAVYDTRALEVEFYRVEYDIQTTAEKILAAGLSPRLAERLKLGW